MLAAASNEHPVYACAHTRSRHCALSLWKGGAGRALAARARRAALVGVAPCTVRGHCTSERPLSFGARPCLDALAVASHAKQAARLAWRKRHCALSLSLSGGGQARVVAARARSAARVVVPPRTVHGLCTSERPLSYGARPCSGVRAVVINAKHPPRLAWRRRHCALSLSRGGAARALAARARHANRCIALFNATAPAWGFSPPVHGRAPMCQLRLLTRSRLARVRTRDYATALCGKEAQQALAARARRAALVGVGLCNIKGHCISQIYSLPRCETVLRRACRGFQRAPGLCVCTHAIVPLRALSLWGGGAGRALVARARRAALVGAAPCIVRGRCTSERPLSFGARPCFDVLAVASHVKQAARLAWRKRH